MDSLGRDKRIIDVFIKIQDMLNAPEPPRSNLIAAEFFRLCDAIHNPKPYKKTKSEQLIERAKAIIESQMHTALNITELASLLNVDRTTLFLAFRKECDCSPIDYLREQRIERACSILASSSKFNLSEIAGICGFSNDKYFIRTFQDLKGTSPRQFSYKKMTESNIRQTEFTTVNYSSAV